MSRHSIHWCSIDAGGATESGGADDALFPWWSFTKTAIAICAVALEEARVLDLDTPLAEAGYSLRHLLQNRSGVPDYGPLPAYHAAVARGEAPWSRDDLLGAVRPERLLFAPGTGWRYSNTGYMLARERIEAASGSTLADLIDSTISRRLGLKSVRLATTRTQFAQVHWRAAARYDPGWVYHGCLIGTPPDAATVLHRLFEGDLLSPAALAVLLDTHPLGGPIPGRPWSRTGYGLGLMSGRMQDVGRAIGHSGAGPFCANAVYRFADLAVQRAVACFTDGPDEGVAEWAAARIARVA